MIPMIFKNKNINIFKFKEFIIIILYLEFNL